ncbi:MAG TPA: hypothetical protein PLM18_03060, partial [Sedimentibacter sp.]|nr:hypothetical protein [Sedimentibacter sp.]
DIQFINKSDDVDVKFEEGEDKIIVRVVGTSTLVNGLEKDDLILTLDLAEAVPGINRVELQCVSEFSFKEITISKESVTLEIVEAAERPQREE